MIGERFTWIQPLHRGLWAGPFLYFAPVIGQLRCRVGTVCGERAVIGQHSAWLPALSQGIINNNTQTLLQTEGLFQRRDVMD